MFFLRRAATKWRIESSAESLEVSQSLFVIADLDTEDGLDLIKESLLSLVGQLKYLIALLLHAS